MTPLNIANDIGIIEFFGDGGQLLLNKVTSPRLCPLSQYIGLLLWL